MLLFLILLLFFLAVFFFRLNGKDVLSPTFITIVLFLFSVFVAFLQNAVWGVDYGGKIVVVFLGSILFMEFGELIGKDIFFRKEKINIKNEFNSSKENDQLTISNKFIVFWCIISVVVLYFSIQDVLRSALLFGYSGKEKALFYSRMASLQGIKDTNVMLAISRFFVQGISLTLMFVTINNIFFDRKKNYIKRILKYFLLTIPGLIVFFLSTSRTVYILIIQIIFFLTVFAWRIKYNNFTLKRFIVWGICALTIFILIFFSIANFTKIHPIENFWNNFSVYISSPIAALNVWLESRTISSYGFGVETFRGFFDLLNRFGFEVAGLSYFSEFICFGDGFTTNIYTAFYHYIKDFGMIGCFFIYFLKGLFFSYFYQNVKINKVFGISALVYTYFAYDFVRQIAAADFLASYLSVSHTFILVFIILGYKIIIIKKKIF